MTARTGTKKNKALAERNEADNLTTFVLPDSLPCSEIDFPLLIIRRPKASWKQILEESEQQMAEVEGYRVEHMTEPIVKAPFLKTESEYMKNELFVHLIPALEEALFKARSWDVLTRPKSFFNGIDHIAQVLWNQNPRYPQRRHENLHIFNFPWVRDYLEHHPRPLYPMSWLWTEDYAATLIQKTVRQYFVQRDEEVQEMRGFWKKLEEEQHFPELKVNPLLSKMFASGGL